MVEMSLLVMGGKSRDLRQAGGTCSDAAHMQGRVEKGRN